MKEELEQKIFKDFPNMYKPERPETESLMCFGFECGDGWFDLLYSLSKDLSEMEDLPEGFEVEQVKSKFGTLRFYPNFGNEKIYERITQAEEESAVTCEDCGKPGKLTGKGWVTTLCEDCYNSNKK